MNALFSHPEVLLSHHLKKVAQQVHAILSAKKLNTGIPDKLLLDLGYLMGAVHDVAKATSFFQTYLLTPEHTVTGPKHHAFLSSLLAKYGAELLVHTHPELAENDRQVLPYLVFVAVKRHHGNMGDMKDELLELGHLWKDADQQMAVIDPQAVQLILNETLEQIDLFISWENFRVYLGQQVKEDAFSNFQFDFFEDSPFEDLTVSQKARYYYLFQLLYSALLLADKRDVILKQPFERGEISDNKFWEYRRVKGYDQPTTALNLLKNQALNEALTQLSSTFDPKQFFYSITLPTGMGKTLTSLGIGLKIRELLQNNTTKLIYAIPFTSIIDQTFGVYQEALTAWRSNQLLKHHHLAEPIFKVGEDEFTPNESSFLIETWESEVVVTTFVQLLETIFSNDKTKLLKLSQLANSIVFLDEVQNIPFEIWPLIRTGFEAIASQYRVYFVFMSATQPLIFKPGTEITELIPNHEQYFLNPLFNRTRLMNRAAAPIGKDNFCEEVITYAAAHPSKNLLIILNSKKITREVFAYLSARISSADSELLFLSTLITPFERKSIIQHLKNDKKGKRNIIVSTQLIEAGVDISVDTVFRALAPLDSLIQAAGRANRNNLQAEPADVFIYDIQELKRVNAMIYGQILLTKTEKVLQGMETANETAYLSLIQAYFEQIQKESAVSNPKELNHLLQLAFEQVGKFKFIEEQKTASLFVQINDEAVAIWDAYEKIISDGSLDHFERKSAFSRIKSTFYDFVINVPIPYGMKEIDMDAAPVHGFYLIRKGQSQEFASRYYAYSPENLSLNTGYFSPKITLEVF